MQSGRIAGPAAKAHSALGGMAVARDREVLLLMILAFSRVSGGPCALRLPLGFYKPSQEPPRGLLGDGRRSRMVKWL